MPLPMELMSWLSTVTEADVTRCSIAFIFVAGEGGDGGDGGGGMGKDEEVWKGEELV